MMQRNCYSLPCTIFSITLLVLCTGGVSSAQTQTRGAGQGGKVLFILDGSGSMWGRIENKPKISIAKELMTGLIRDLPANIDPGLEVYGHRSKGDCSDIELLSPIGQNNKETLIQQIQSISPKGKTPITRSFQLAAERLREYEDETTVVLISDGKETCSADPCRLVRELRDSGVKVRVHVVGFDVNQDEREQLVCIAEAGGGKYFSADNTEQLQQALTEVKQEVVKKVEQPPPPSKPETLFVAIDAGTGEPVSSLVEWTFINTATEDVQILQSSGAELQTELPAGEYEIYASAAGVSGEEKLQITGEPGERFTVRLGAGAEPKPFDAPASIAAGEVLRFGWRGPNIKGDMIFIAKPNMPENEYYLSREQRHLTEQGAPAVLTAPAEPGSYEIRYFSYNNGAVLARAPLDVTPPTVQLDAPGRISAGKPFNFNWTGPDSPGDMLFIAEPGMADNQYWLSSEQRHLTSKGSPASLIAPAEPGSYEIRYYSKNNATVLARFPLAVVESEVTLDAPRVVSVGTMLEVGWTGPDAPGDMIFIAEPNMAENHYYLSDRQRHLISKGSPATLTVPAKAGTYEIRYYSKNNGKVLAKRALIVR